MACTAPCGRLQDCGRRDRRVIDRVHELNFVWTCHRHVTDASQLCHCERKVVFCPRPRTQLPSESWKCPAFLTTTAATAPQTALQAALQAALPSATRLSTEPPSHEHSCLPLEILCHSKSRQARQGRRGDATFLQGPSMEHAAEPGGRCSCLTVLASRPRSARHLLPKSCLPASSASFSNMQSSSRERSTMASSMLHAVSVDLLFLSDAIRSGRQSQLATLNAIVRLSTVI